MTLFRLSSRAREILQRVVRSHSDAREVRRAQILLALDRQECAESIAKRVGRVRQTLYVIVQRYKEQRALPVVERIRDQARPGRPATKRERATKIIRELLTKPPARYRYRSPVWTVPMLHYQVQRRLKCAVSTWTVRRALRRLRYRFKRPRYVFAQRPLYWRQAKGGLKKGSNDAGAR